MVHDPPPSALRHDRHLSYLTREVVRWHFQQHGWTDGCRDADRTHPAVGLLPHSFGPQRSLDCLVRRVHVASKALQLLPNGSILGIKAEGRRVATLRDPYHSHCFVVIPRRSGSWARWKDRQDTLVSALDRHFRPAASSPADRPANGRARTGHVALSNT
jgi:hypothetical protein